MVTCKVCGISLSDDLDGRDGKVWINVEFGALQNANGDAYESDILGYQMYWLDSADRVIPTAVTNDITDYKTPRFGVVAPTSTCCNSGKYSGVYTGDKPKGALKIGVVPFTVSDGTYYYLPIGATKDFTDSKKGRTKVYTFTAEFAMDSYSDVPEFEMLVKDALAQVLGGAFVVQGVAQITKDMVAVLSITTSDATTTTTVAPGGATTTTADATTAAADANTTTVAPGGRRLSATTVIVRFALNVPQEMHIKLSDIDLDELKNALIALALAAGVNLPALTGTPTASGLSSEWVGENPTVAWAAPTGSLGLLPLLMAVLALFQ